MRILLIDDDSNKVEQILAYISTSVQSSDVTVRRSFQSGLKEALGTQYDLILLDMTMPSYDVGPREPGGRDRRYAGREILRQLWRRNKPAFVVVVTQYEQFEEDGVVVTIGELIAALQREFSCIFRGAIFYQAGNTSWMNELGQVISEMGVARDRH